MTEPLWHTSDVLAEIYRERLHQERLRARGKFAWTCSARGPSHEEKLAVLAEEFGEASREVVERMIARDQGRAEDEKDAVRRLRKELIQVAAVAVAWAESIPVE